MLLIQEDFVKSRQEIILVSLDKILSSSYDELPWNVGISSSLQHVSSSARDVKIMHVLSRCVEFRFPEFLFDLEFVIGNKIIVYNFLKPL